MTKVLIEGKFVPGKVTNGTWGHESSGVLEKRADADESPACCGC